jgi:hypothetical protein
MSSDWRMGETCGVLVLLLVRLPIISVVYHVYRYLFGKTFIEPRLLSAVLLRL